MLNVFVAGLAIGMVFAAVALMYNVMYSTSKVLSVTTGHLSMLGGVFGAYVISVLHLNWVWGLSASILVGAAFGWITEFVGVRRILAKSDEHLWLLSTLALATIVQQIIGLWWGTEPKPFPRLIDQDFNAGALDQKFWLPIVVTLLMAVGLEIFYKKTMYGKVFMAMSEDPFAARARGISTDQIRQMSYLLSGALGGLSGFAAGQLTFAYFALGLTLTLNGFIALAVGGLGSNMGALIGGIALGLLNAFASHWFGGEYQQTLAVGLLLTVLLVKPEGLLGSRKLRPV
jgi:branched-chain amino acid transport system permease protein